jgi:hypothetical protein
MMRARNVAVSRMGSARFESGCFSYNSDTTYDKIESWPIVLLCRCWSVVVARVQFAERCKEALQGVGRSARVQFAARYKEALQTVGRSCPSVICWTLQEVGRSYAGTICWTLLWVCRNCASAIAGCYKG